MVFSTTSGPDAIVSTTNRISTTAGRSGEMRISSVSDFAADFSVAGAFSAALGAGLGAADATGAFGAAGFGSGGVEGVFFSSAIVIFSFEDGLLDENHYNFFKTDKKSTSRAFKSYKRISFLAPLFSAFLSAMKLTPEKCFSKSYFYTFLSNSLNIS
jgi:hypothetical protein